MGEDLLSDLQKTLMFLLPSDGSPSVNSLSAPSTSDPWVVTPSKSFSPRSTTINRKSVGAPFVTISSYSEKFELDVAPKTSRVLSRQILIPERRA